MKTEKISERDLKALLWLGCVVALGLAWLIGFKGFLQDANAVKLENIELQTKVDDLERKNREKDNVIKETKEFEKNINEIVAKYPNKVTPEKVFYDMNMLQTKLGKLQFTSVAAHMNGLFYPESADGTAAENAAPSDPNDTTNNDAFTSRGVVTVYKSTIETKLKALSYVGLKDLVKEVNRYNGRLTMDEMRLNFSRETGLLEGEIKFGMYALEGSSTEYKVPDISGISSGVKNIFGTFDANKKSDVKKKK